MKRTQADAGSHLNFSAHSLTFSCSILPCGKLLGDSYKPFERANGCGGESTVLFPNPSLPSTCSSAVTTCLSAGGRSSCPSGVVWMPRLARRSLKRLTVLNSCFFSSSRAETCCFSWPSDWTKASTRPSRLQTRAWDTWVGRWQVNAWRWPWSKCKISWHVSACVCMVPAAPQAGQGSAVGGSDWSFRAVQLAGVGWGLVAYPAAHPARRGTPPRRPGAAYTHPSHTPNTQRENSQCVAAPTSNSNPYS